MKSSIQQQAGLWAGRVAVLSILAWLLPLLLSAAPQGAPTPKGIPNQECLDCHQDPPQDKALARSIHSSLSCTDCHAGIQEIPHAEKVPPAQCATCHESDRK